MAQALDLRRFQARPVVKFGCFSMTGGRDYQEDRITALPDVNYSGIGYFAVFDGHGGSYVSDFLCRNFHLQLSLHSLFKYQPLVALDETWKIYDEKLFDACSRYEMDKSLEYFPIDGSTATVCLVQQDFVHITNCGDSAAFVVYSDGHTEMVSEDHGTLNDLETARCLQAGAQLLTMQEFGKLQAQAAQASTQPPVLDRTAGTNYGEINSCGGFFSLFSLCCSGVFLTNNVVSPNDVSASGKTEGNGTNDALKSNIGPKNNTGNGHVASLRKSNRSNQSNSSSNRQQRSFKLGFKNSNQNQIKRRVFPGGLLVTRAFGDFYGKKEHLGGIKGGIISDHGSVKSIDIRKDKVKYILLGSDGIWDVLQVDQVIAIIEGRPGNHKAIVSGVTSTGGSAGPTTTSSGEDATKINHSKALSAVLPESTASPANSTRSGMSLG